MADRVLELKVLGVTLVSVTDRALPGSDADDGPIERVGEAFDDVNQFAHKRWWHPHNP